MWPSGFEINRGDYRIRIRNLELLTPAQRRQPAFSVGCHSQLGIVTNSFGRRRGAAASGAGRNRPLWRHMAMASRPVICG